ncbi:MBL fold metallo-hydrolase [Eubacterium multiforme]|uniref:L-ascorbate metabolism protein UlaG (Beta-lactamase superfamily) n=1 Tax=Eubacterium multiforme TaxID=83339 RepID=A0ABT9UTZ2_9FIRM|nr:MBL fold metallo-hydrolase [Eubacterium multiforme]MDQ0149775.1 L-ascorbate metabolism protein UlaG (beta-lactamase superfamily) [Eubacterium multiforme]
MDITWIENSTFFIKTSMGKRLLIDPFNKFHNCNISDLNPNVITLSSFQQPLSYKQTIDPNINIINSCGNFNTDIGLIKGYTTFCDDFNGTKRGENIIYTYDIDNLKLCHLGYLGEILSDNLIQEIGKIDILFLPVGGNITLSGKEAYLLSKKISPKIIIPMNYKAKTSSFLFNGLKEFSLLLKNIRKFPNKSFRIFKETLDSNKGTIVLPINCK